MNPALNQHPIHDLLRQRWSPRAFSERPVEKEPLLSLLEAARWAPSCFNEQPWSFIVATKEEPAEYERLLRCLVESNQRWAQQAPVLLLSVAKLAFDHNGKPNRHAWHEVGLAAANLTVQAGALGLCVHQMGGFRADQAREEFHIPPTHEPVAMLALGFLGNPDQLPEDLREKEQAPRTRKALSTFVFTGDWEETPPWVNDED